MADDRRDTRVSLAREQDFRFRIRFGADGIPAIISDEPPPLGGGAGPNPTALLAAAVGNCLASSLLFCLQKSRLEVREFEAEVVADTVREPSGRLRIAGMRVRLAPTVSPEVRERMGRCLDLFEDFCIVTQSVRRGIEVTVEVEPRVAAAAEAAPQAVGRPPCAVTVGR
jgi:uncharacterized OsmC-like protein